MKRATLLTACILFLSFVATASATLYLQDSDVYPSADFRPGQMVHVSAAVEIIPSGATTFAGGHTLVLSTDMEDAHWDVRVMVDAIVAAVIQKDTNHLFVNGYLLSYPTDRDVSVSVQLVGAAPGHADETPFSLLRVAELNNQGMIVGGSELHILSSIPASATPNQTLPAMVTPSPGVTPATPFPFHAVLSGLFCAFLLLKR